MGQRTDLRCVCKDCKQEFIFTAAEREEYAAQGYYHAPGRCPACRDARTLRKQGQSAARGLHSVICARCGARTRVPFLPRTEKPVYCRACFLEKRGA